MIHYTNSMSFLYYLMNIKYVSYNLNVVLDMILLKIIKNILKCQGKIEFSL